MIRYLLSLLFALSFLAGCGVSEVAEAPVYLNTYSDSLPFLEAFAAATQQADARLENYPIRAAILPHHLVAAESIARVFAALQYQKPKHIILISPDHFSQCENLLCVTDGEFQTLFGVVKADAANIQTLTASKLVTKDAEIFTREHGIFALLPFLATYTPQVLLTPIVIPQKNLLRWYASEAEILKLLQPMLTADTVLIISSDFSHYLSVAESDLRDEETAKAIFTPDSVAIRKLNNPANSDCPNCLSLVTDLALQNNFFNPTLVSHTNSARILKDLTVKETTSHFAILYYENSSLASRDAAFAGDVTLVRGNQPQLSPEANLFWQGDGLRIVNLENPLAETCEANPNPYIFCTTEATWKNIKNLATHWGMQNNHMFDNGIDSLSAMEKIITANSEIPLATTYENADLRIIPITLLLNPVATPKDFNLGSEYEKVMEILKNKKDEKLTVVFAHGGEEFTSLPNEAFQKKLEAFITAGADAVIATHAHLPSPLVIYKGKPIFTGIGNFVFDQHSTIPTETAILLRLRKENDKVLFETLHARNSVAENLH
ncbi:MAG: AmmeMemoRadiSam system protein B [Candidatus Gracilibacteria bacterium]